MGSVGTILQANNIHRVAKANYDAAVAKQVSGNKREAANVALANFSRSLKNNVQQEKAGKDFNAGAEQLVTELTAMSKSSVNTQLAYAEAQGVLKAQSAMLGVGGASVDLMDGLVTLKRDTELEEQQEAVRLLATRGQSSLASNLAAGVTSLDFSRTLGSFDYTQHIAPKAMKRRLGKLIGVAVATYFGGPMAGEAVADLAVGEWKASNGDFAGANQSFGSAMSKGASAYSAWGQRGGNSWGGDILRQTRRETPQAVQRENIDYNYDVLSDINIGWS